MKNIIKEKVAIPDTTEMTAEQAAAAMNGIVFTQALSLAMHNAVAAQQQSQIVQTAVVSMVCKEIASVKRMGIKKDAEKVVSKADAAPKKAATAKPKIKKNN